MTGDQVLHESVRAETVESARCDDCSWVDEAAGARGRGGRHAHSTGHRVITTGTTTYIRSGVPQIPGQTNLYDFLEDRAA